MTSAEQSPQPVPPPERLAAVDVLRGAALLGILVMNVVAYAWPITTVDNPNLSGGADAANKIVWAFGVLLFKGKMMALFSMLFGAGLVLLGNRAKLRSAPICGLYFRRIFWLLVIGMAHAYLIWDGDILVYYAISGALVFLFRRQWASMQIAIGTAFVLLGISVVFASLLAAKYEDKQTRRQGDKERRAQANKPIRPVTFFDPSAKEIRKEIAIYRSGYAEIFRRRSSHLWRTQIGIYFGFMLFIGTGWMLVGMGLMKLGVFSAERSWRCYWLLAIFGFGIGLPVTALGAIDLLQNDFRMDRAPLGETALHIGMTPVALGHVAAVMMACKVGVFARLLSPFAAVGRMALSNYLMQSLICTFIFYGYGFGLFGRVDRVGLWGVVVGVWIVQLAYSPLWLKFFRYGPAEWLWRSLAYWKLQPMRNAG